jgi:hypothetical protein
MEEVPAPDEHRGLLYDAAMRRFEDLIARQLTIFGEDYADLLTACAAAERAYDRAGADEAEERYAAFLDLVEEGSEALGEIKSTYASTLDPDQAEAYERAFDEEVARRLPPFGLGL